MFKMHLFPFGSTRIFRTSVSLIAVALARSRSYIYGTHLFFTLIDWWLIWWV